MKKSLMILACAVAASTMMVSCVGSGNETPEEGKFSASLAGNYDLTGIELVMKTSVEKFEYDGVTLFTVEEANHVLDSINLVFATELQSSNDSFTLRLGEDGTFGFVTTSTTEEGTETFMFPEDFVVEEDYPFLSTDFTWFSTASKLYFAVDRLKFDDALATIPNPEVPETEIGQSIVKLSAAVMNRMPEAIAATDAPAFDIEKYLASLLYISNKVYALPVKYNIAGNVLTLIPVDKAFLNTALAAADVYFHDYIKTVAEEEQIQILAEWNFVKGAVGQVLADCTKLQIEISFKK